jgi:biopolymer transport protein TolQ
MTALSLLAAAASAPPGHLDPLKLFRDADIVVQVVMAGLILASVWTWALIVGISMRLGRVRRRSAAYEAGFWKAQDLAAYHAAEGSKDVPSARIAGAGLAEWRRSTGGKSIDREGTRQRLSTVLSSTVADQADALAERLNFLATVGSVAPFVGLFGTVWGIMNAFFQIGQRNDSSLATVAPGISEALFATAIGLFAAIPAVIAYNRFAHRVNAIEGRLQRFADRFQATLSRELEEG